MPPLGTELFPAPVPQPRVRRTDDRRGRELPSGCASCSYGRAKSRGARGRDSFVTRASRFVGRASWFVGRDPPGLGSGGPGAVGATHARRVLGWGVTGELAMVVDGPDLFATNGFSVI